MLTPLANTSHGSNALQDSDHEYLEPYTPKQDKFGVWDHLPILCRNCLDLVKKGQEKDCEAGLMEESDRTQGYFFFGEKGRITIPVKQDSRFEKEDCRSSREEKPERHSICDLDCVDGSNPWAVL